MRSVSSIARVTAASLHRRCRLPSKLRPDPPTRRWPLRRFPRSSRRIGLAAVGLAGDPARRLAFRSRARTVPKSAGQHDAAVQSGHYRHHRVRAYNCSGRGSHRGSASARAQDHRVRVPRQDPDACIVDVQTLCSTRLRRAVFSRRRSLRTSSKRRRSYGSGLTKRCPCLRSKSRRRRNQSAASNDYLMIVQRLLVGPAPSLYLATSAGWPFRSSNDHTPGRHGPSPQRG
jgi:hypothetical protein